MFEVTHCNYSEYKIKYDFPVTVWKMGSLRGYTKVQVGFRQCNFLYSHKSVT